MAKNSAEAEVKHFTEKYLSQEKLLLEDEDLSLGDTLSLRGEKDMP